MQNQCLGFSADGSEVDVESAACVAKRVDGIHFIKVATYGGKKGLFFNPQSSISSFSSGRSNREEYEFRRVTTECFGHYTQFLKTQDPCYLRHAQRV